MTNSPEVSQQNSVYAGGMSDLNAITAAAGTALQNHSYRIATAESCTGGWIMKALTDIDGSSAWADRAAVTYSNAAKIDMLGVPADLIERDGAVSEAVVMAMVDGVVRFSGVEVGIAVSGIAGPSGGSYDKPVGTVWIAWQHPGGMQAQCFRFDGDRDAVRRQTVEMALARLPEILGPVVA